MLNRSKRAFNFVFVLAVMVLQYGCANMQVENIQEDNPAAKKEATSFSANKEYAQLYIGRESTFVGAAVPLGIKIADDTLLQFSESVGLYGGEYIHLKLKPASYYITYFDGLWGSGREKKTHYKAVPGRVDFLYCSLQEYLNVDFFTGQNHDDLSNCKIKSLDGKSKEIFKDSDLIKAPNVIVKQRKPKKQKPKQKRDDDYTAWRKADERGTIGAYLAFIKKYPKSTFVKLARNKIKQLQSFK